MKVKTFQQVKPWLNMLKEQDREDKYVSTLDPLNFDETIRKLPRLNESGDVATIVRHLYLHIPRPDKLNGFNYAESLACMRDLGLYLGSIKRHGVEPLEAVPELDYILDVLSMQTDMPPRDTLLHYTQWNPTGKRVRTYTSYQDEIVLIESVRVATSPLLIAIYQLLDLYMMDPRRIEFVELCQAIKINFNRVIEGIVMAKRNVSPEIFANVLRYYFDPIEVYGKQYIGPGAVEMPLFVYDFILWGSDVDNPKYQEFSRAYLPFNLPAIRDIYYNFIGKSSMVEKMITELEHNPYNEHIYESAKMLLSLCKLEKSFRIPHKKLAEESYEKQDDKDKKEVGSGGYSTSILSDILQENLSQIDRLGRAMESYRC